MASAEDRGESRSPKTPSKPSLSWEQITDRAESDAAGVGLPRPGVRRFFCPMCRVERRTRLASQPGWRHFAQVGLAAAVVALALGPWWGAKGAVVFVPLWIGFELVYRLRVRRELACPDCGFDPFLQLRDRAVARRALDTHWRAKFAEKGLPWPEPELSPSAAPRVERPAGLPEHEQKSMDELVPEPRV